MQTGLEGLPEDCAVALSAAAGRHRYRPGSALCRQGDPSSRIELIESGRAVGLVTTNSGSQISLGILGPGDVVGELSVLTQPTEHTATVTALEETVTLALSKSEFDRLRRRHPELGDLVTQALARRLDALGRSLVQELSSSAEERVLRKLLDVSEGSQPAGQGNSIALTQEELGRLTGTARGTVNRVLRHEVGMGTIRLARGRITIADAAALRARLGEPAGKVGQPHVPGAIQPAEQRRVATVVVISLDVQAIGADVEDDRAAFVRYQNLVKAEIERFGGSFHGFHGDTGVAVFGAPLARGDDAQQGVSAAASVVAAVTELNPQSDRHAAVARAGVATGEILIGVLEGGEARLSSGDLAQTAARLRSAAPAGKVMVDEATHQATLRVLPYESVSGGWLHATTSPTPAAQTTPFVGRTNELQELWSSWEAVTSERRPRLVTILGVSGIGKSKLASELVRRVEALGGQTFRGRSLPFGAGTGYSAFVQMVTSEAGISAGDSVAEALEKLAAAVRTAVGDGADEIASRFALMAGFGEQQSVPDQQALFRSACQFVEGLGRSRPTLLVFEDLHWADASLQDLVRALASRVRGVAVMLVASARPELLDSRPDWSGGLASALTIELEGLSREDSTRLVAAIVPSGYEEETRARVVEVAEGNPLFIEELAANMAEQGSVSAGGLPVTIHTAIEARLDVLPAPARTVLVSASVIGRSFSRATLARLVPKGNLDENLEHLLSRGFIRREPVSRFPGDPEYAFKHILVRDVAYRTIPRSVREQAHAQVARFLERWMGGPLGEGAALLSHHWREAGEPDRSLRFLVEAAERASRAAAHREAVALLSDAIEMATRLDRPNLAELKARRGIALARIGRWSEARPELEAAGQSLLEPAERRIQVLVELALVCHWLLDLEGCRRNAWVAVELARTAQRADLEAAALGAVALADSSDGKVTTSLERLQASIATAGDRRFQLLGPTLELCGLTLYWTGRPADAVEVGEAALRIGNEFADVNTSIRTLGNLGLALGASGRYRESFETFDKARTFGREYGTAPFLARALAMRGGVHLDVFDYEAAQALAEESRELASSLGFPLPVVSAGIDLMFIWARTGEVGRGENLIPEVEKAIASAQGSHGWLWRLRFAQARAEISAARGDWEAAERLAMEAIARAQATGRVKYMVAGLGVEAAAMAHSGRHRLALEAARRALEAAEGTGDPAMRLRAASVMLEIAPDDAVVTAARSAADAISSGLPEGQMRQRFLDSAVAKRAGARAGS